MSIKNTNTLPPCIIGTWAWGGGAAGAKLIFGRKTDNQQLYDTFTRAMENGFTFWDTAEVYGQGASSGFTACTSAVSSPSWNT